jgi:hypothetical protein
MKPSMYTLYFIFSSFVYFEAKRIEIKMVADSPRKVFGKAEF